jgi:hypothetical protein
MNIEGNKDKGIANSIGQVKAREKRTLGKCREDFVDEKIGGQKRKNCE